MEITEGFPNLESVMQPGTIRRHNTINGSAKARNIAQQRDSYHPIDDEDLLENFAPILKLA